MNIIYNDEKHITDKTGVTESVVAIEKKKHIGQFHLHAGQKIFQLDLVNAIVEEADLENTRLEIGEDRMMTKTRDLIIKEDHIYCVDLNFENAHRKFHKMLGTKPKKKKPNEINKTE